MTSHRVKLPRLRRKGDAKSTITVSLRCDVDAAFAAD